MKTDVSAESLRDELADLVLRLEGTFDTAERIGLLTEIDRLQAKLRESSQ